MYFKKLNKEGKDITTQHNRIRTDLESHMLNIFINYLETLFPVPTKSSRNEFIKKSLITVIHISTALYITTASIMATAHTSAFFCLHRGTLQVSVVSDSRTFVYGLQRLPETMSAYVDP